MYSPSPAVVSVCSDFWVGSAGATSACENTAKSDEEMSYEPRAKNKGEANKKTFVLDTDVHCIVVQQNNSLIAHVLNV